MKIDSQMRKLRSRLFFCILHNLWSCHFTTKINRSQMFFIINGPKNFIIFTGKNLRWSLFLITLQAFRAATLLKKRLQHSFFPVNSAKSLKTAFLQNTCGGCFCTAHYPSYIDKKIKSIFQIYVHFFKECFGLKLKLLLFL